MKSLNEIIDAKLATLRRQLTQIHQQIKGLEAYRNAAKPAPNQPAKKRQTPPQTKPPARK